MGDQLKPGTTVKVAHGSKVAFLLGADVVSELRGGSVAVLKLRKNKDWTVELKNGAVFSLVNNPLKRPEHFRVSTHAASMGVRGTAFFVKTSKHAPDFLCTCSGTVNIKNPKGKLLKEITSKHHDEPVVIDQTLKKAPEGMDPDHTDEQGAELAKLFN